jgi:heme/copper-type cytochrome/quinol oxidase subunit 3
MRKETISLKIHTTTVQINFLTGMILFIISEIMIFFGFF